jgi:uncharacterized protein (TIGR02597 family)
VLPHKKFGGSFRLRKGFRLCKASAGREHETDEAAVASDGRENKPVDKNLGLWHHSTLMKKLLPLSALLALLAAPLCLAQDAVTDPVGVVTHQTMVGSDMAVAPTLHREPVFSGVIQEISNGNVITVANNPDWTQDTLAGTHYLLVCDGDRQGLFASVAANTQNSMTLEFISETLGSEQGDRVEPGDFIKVIPYWTLATLFPDGSVPDRTEVLVFDRNSTGINKAGSPITYFDGFGWYAGPTNKNNENIFPDESLVLRPPSGSTAAFSVTGHVPMVPLRVSVGQLANGIQQDTRISNPFPIEVPLQVLLEPGNSANGDEVLVFDNSNVGINKAGAPITYYTGFGWYAGPTNSNSRLIAPGQGLVYRRAATNTPPLVIPQSSTHLN